MLLALHLGFMRNEWHLTSLLHDIVLLRIHGEYDFYGVHLIGALRLIALLTFRFSTFSTRSAFRSSLV